MASTPTVSAYKGKFTHRSWPQLPEELIRLIATYFLWDLSATNYCPQQWEAKELWHSRMVYVAIRDAQELERIMQVCPQWCHALETHLFWQQAVALIDPLDALGHFAIVRPQTNNSSSQPVLRLTPYRHFRNISISSCIICRINSTMSNQGLGAAKRTIPTSPLGLISVCREHNHHRITYCGLCLREAPPIDPIEGRVPVACLENEDEETWPGIDATCRSCRAEWLWRRVSSNPRDREAIGGHRFYSSDWETRQTVEGFIDMAEGTISDVVQVAQEKLWFRKNTKLPELMSQALAANRYTGRENTFDASEEELSLSEMEEEDEDDPDIMQMTEDSGGIRELAIGDWARSRILDGHWLAPADQYYGHTVPNRPTFVRAVHPCPWALDADEQTDPSDEHPRPAIAQGEVPPSFQLCERAHLAYQKQLRVILLPVMRNIVRKLVIECSVDGFDPALKASRMSMEDVLAELRDEAVWFDGIDWLEKRRNAQRDQRESRLRHAREEGSDDSACSTASSKSGDSDTTSPVLSTTTLQTTPSPPPNEDKVVEEAELVSRPVTIAVDPVLDPPRLLRPIPHIPVTISHLPQYSLDSFKTVWRNACEPLYHCRCSICERAQTKETGLSVASQATSPVILVPAAPIPAPKQVEIRLVEVDNPEGEEELEEEEEEEEDADANDSDVAENGSLSSYSPSSFTPPPEPIRSRKRSNEELEYEGGGDADAEGEMDDELRDSRRSRGRSPPKRLKRDGPVPPRYQGEKFLSGRMRKRSSEELESGDGDDDASAHALDNKRTKLSVELPDDGAHGVDAASPPMSLTGTEPNSISSPSEREAADSLPQERTTLCAVKE
ncbi:hypothetical protein HGRIS_001769 [Hohenbuehelia grisea]|uniref:F-box domain-containing protein n=1 Tax=Hohenbuehelia grisea TaxID=104357 RepID=A0ABR3JIH7_9AGAR